MQQLASKERGLGKRGTVSHLIISDRLKRPPVTDPPPDD
jgi:hypothetical protein